MAQRAAKPQVNPIQKFMLVEEVADRLQCSESKAYKVMRQLNNELKAKGKIVISGRLSRRYFEERFY